MPGSSNRLIKRAIQAAALVALVIGGYYVIHFAVVTIMWVNILSGRDLMDASAKNARGDIVSAESDTFGTPERQAKTVIRLHRAGHWFSTTLVEAHSWEVQLGLHWRDNDTLDVKLGLGCDAQIEPPVTVVGPIHIVYYWGDPGHVPKGGYESFRRRDLPPEPCPKPSAAAPPK